MEGQIRKQKETGVAMQRSYIIKLANDLAKQYQTRDPFALAQALGLSVQFSDIGGVKGFYTVISGKRFVVLNDALDSEQATCILAHEIGHDRLHRHFAADRTLQDIMLYDMESQPEHEANIFAAALILDKNQVFRLAKEGKTVQQIACILSVDENLVTVCLESE